MNKKALILTLLIAGVCGQMAFSQDLRKEKDIRKEKDEFVEPEKKEQPAKKVEKPKTSTPQVEEKKFPDTVYCRNTSKQHGWYKPQFIVDKQNIDKYDYLIRLTCPLSDGKYTVLEEMNGFGEFCETTHFQPYILSLDNRFDSTGNSGWQQFLRGACRYEIIPDPSQQQVVQERAFDRDHNILYTFSITPIGDNKFVGAYRDMRGFPAEMRYDPSYAYGTLVELTRDRWGNDSIIKITDAKGVAKPNKDDAYATQLVCDSLGRMLSMLSLDEDGKYMIDNSGNCGNLYTYYDSISPYLMRKIINVDANLQPMMFFSLLDVAEKGTYMQECQYDRLGRDSVVTFYDAEGRPSQNIYGAHKIFMKKDAHGNNISTQGFSLKGEPAVFNAGGVAKILWEYDSMGRNTSMSAYDKNGNLAMLPTMPFALAQAEFIDSIGTKNEYYWSIDRDGNKYLASYTKTTPHRVENKMMYNNYLTVDSLDDKGHIVLRSIYLDGKLKNGLAGWAITKDDFYEGEDSRSFIETFYDENQEQVVLPNGIYRIVLKEINDTINWGRSENKDGIVMTSFLQRVDSTGSYQWQMDANAFGIPCRNGGDNLSLYYKIYSPQSNIGINRSFIAKDEFGEPDYVFSSTGTYYFQNQDRTSYLYGLQYGNNYDENGDEITDLQAFVNHQAKAVSVEVIDQKGYDKGFKDNDLIIKLGDDLNLMGEDTDFAWTYGRWAKLAVLNAPNEYSAVVYRIDPETLESSLVKIDNLKGPLSDNGVLTHRRILTHKQMDRIFSTVWDNVASENPYVSVDDFDFKVEDDTHNVVVCYPYSFRGWRSLPYQKEIVDPAILIAMASPRTGEIWKFDDDAQELVRMLFNAGEKNTQRFYFTKDGKTMRMLEVNGNSGGDWSLASLNDDQYAQFETLAKKTLKNIEQEKIKRLKIKPQQLEGKWSAPSQREENGTTEDGILEMEFRDDVAYFTYTRTLSQNIDVDHKIILKYRTSYNELFKLNGNTIVFNPDKCDFDAQLIDAYVLGPWRNNYNNQVFALKEQFENFANGEDPSTYPQLANEIKGVTYNFTIEEVGDGFIRMSNPINVYLFEKVED